MALENAVNERVSFLKGQINLSNKEIVNKSFQAQIDALRTANHEKVALLVLQKKKQLEKCKDMNEIEMLYSQLEALEWLQRQVVAQLK
jgi:hypothetical protein